MHICNRQLSVILDLWHCAAFCVISFFYEQQNCLFACMVERLRDIPCKLSQQVRSLLVLPITLVAGEAVVSSCLSVRQNNNFRMKRLLTQIFGVLTLSRSSLISKAIGQSSRPQDDKLRYDAIVWLKVAKIVHLNWKLQVTATEIIPSHWNVAKLACATSSDGFPSSKSIRLSPHIGNKILLLSWYVPLFTCWRCNS